MSKAIMLRRTEITIVTIFFAVMIVLLTYCGVLASFRQYAGGMGLCFFLVVYSAECCVCIVLNHKIESRFNALAELITDRPVSDRLVGKFVPNAVIISMLIFFVVISLFSILAYNRKHWLVLCILLAVFLIGNSVSTALTVWLKVKACSKHLEELVPRNSECGARTKPGKL